MRLGKERGQLYSKGLEPCDEENKSRIPETNRLD